jgi:hypothetical protein
MIENEGQYRVAKAQAARLENGLARLRARRPEGGISDPVLRETALAAVEHMLAELNDEIAQYELRTHRIGVE